MQPSPGGDAVGDIGEFVRPVDLDEVFEDRCLDEIGMKLRNTVDLVAADHGKVCHAHHLGLRFLNDGNTTQHVAVLGEVTLNILQELQVDVVDDLKVTRKKMLKQRDRPLLQCLWQDGVVRVTEGRLHNGPRLVPFEALLIDQDTLQLRDGKRRVGVVELWECQSVYVDNRKQDDSSVDRTWMATWLGKSFQAFLDFLNRLTISNRDAAHQKYCCFKRSSLPRSRLSFGYRTAEIVSARC